MGDRVEACDLLPVLIPQEGDSKAGGRCALSTGDLLLVLQNLSKLLNRSGASFSRLLGSQSIFAHGFLSVVMFLLCENPHHLILLVTVFCPSSVMDTDPGFLMSTLIQPLHKAGIKESHQSYIIPPSPNTRRITHRTSGHLIQKTLWKSTW